MSAEMSSDPSRSAVVLWSAVLALSLVLWLSVVATTFEMNASDPAGRGMARGFAGIGVIVLWLLLSVLLLISASLGNMPTIAQGSAMLLLPVSGAAAFAAIGLAADTSRPSAPWPLVIPALAPLVIIGYCLWLFIPALRSAISSSLSGAIAGGVLLLLSLAPWPFVRARSTAGSLNRARVAAEYERERNLRDVAVLEAKRTRLEKLTSDSALWAWMEFLEGDGTMRAQAIAGIAALPTRQAEAESMLQGRAWNIVYELPHLSLSATPALCEGVAAFLRDAAAKFGLPTRGDLGRALGFHRLDLYMPSVSWLATRGCVPDAELAAIEAGIRAYEPSDERDAYLRVLGDARAQMRRQ